MNNFVRATDVSFSEEEGRRDARKKLLTFGIDYLTDTMAGIMPHDLILIGAGSGMGKTQLCCSIARANIEKGKRVHYIALEAERAEIERRIKYSIFSRLFFNDPDRPKWVNLSYQNYVLGDYFKSCDKFEIQATREFLHNFSSLFIFNKLNEFTTSDLIKNVLDCAHETDLIIVDHVHYFDFEDTNENRAMKDVAKTARMLSLENGKPIILVSHLRKRDKFSTDLVPDIEEFHGSSDLYKIATRVITLAGGKSDTNGMCETFFRVCKNRFAGEVTRYLGRTLFNMRQGTYESGYEIGHSQQKRGEEFVKLEEFDIPSWATSRSSKSGLYPVSI